jgi:hypothetical protein
MTVPQATLVEMLLEHAARNPRQTAIAATGEAVS